MGNRNKLGFLCFVLFVWVIALALLSSHSSPAQTEAPTDLNALRLEIEALQLIHDLDLKPVQYRQLAELAKGTAAQSETRKPPKAHRKLRQALADLREALVRGNDPAITASQERVDELVEAEESEFDLEIHLTPMAINRAPDVLRLLNARQLGTLLRTFDLEDPTELLLDSLRGIRVLDGKEKEQEAAQIANEVVWLAHGFDAGSSPIKERVVKLLDRAHDLKEEDFKKQLPELEKAVREIIGPAAPMKVLSHIVEHGLAELLANPRLESALKVLIAVRRVPEQQPERKL